LGTIDFRRFEGDTIAIHFGGLAANIDAYTFANSLVAFADAVHAVDALLNPGEIIELHLVAQGPGSYRAVLKRVRKGLPGIFSRGIENVIWGIIATLVYENVIKNDPAPKILVTTSEVIIEHGKDKIIVPRDAYDALPNVRKNPEVHDNLARTFRALENDEQVTNFGLTAKIDDPDPIVLVPREKFKEFIAPLLPAESPEKVRQREERARLVILKAWLTHGKRKWSFEWNGVPLSAPISDDEFLNGIDSREYLIGSGDALDVILTYRQQFDEQLGVYVNDPNSFRVTRVIRPVPRDPKLGLKSTRLRVRSRS
jgi:hypothetical protein